MTETLKKTKITNEPLIYQIVTHKAENDLLSKRKQHQQSGKPYKFLSDCIVTTTYTYLSEDLDDETFRNELINDAKDLIGEVGEAADKYCAGDMPGLTVSGVKIGANVGACFMERFVNSAKDESNILMPSREVRLLGTFGAFHDQLHELGQVYNKKGVQKNVFFQLTKSLEPVFNKKNKFSRRG